MFTCLWLYFCMCLEAANPTIDGNLKVIPGLVCVKHKFWDCFQISTRYRELAESEVPTLFIFALVQCEHTSSKHCVLSKLLCIQCGALCFSGEELEISMHQTKSDNLDEIMASYMEHSNADDLNQSQDDSSDTSSDLDSGVKVTQVKVSYFRTRNVNVFFSVIKCKSKFLASLLVYKSRDALLQFIFLPFSVQIYV